MGRQLGYFSDDDQTDFPNLNKCPDCETFFETLTCPLCGKTCPESMRAGNRKPVKVKKKKYRNSNNGRVRFVPWYLSTWFIILMLFIQPIVGLILLWVSDWQRTAKIIVTALAVLYFFGSFLFGGLFGLFDALFMREDVLVDTSLSREEYVEKCEEPGAETIFRDAENRKGDFVTLTVTVRGVWENTYEYDSEYPIYMECVATEGEKVWTFLVRDVREETINLTAGDVITVYGQIAGNAEIYNYTAGDITAPCINMRYFEFFE